MVSPALFLGGAALSGGLSAWGSHSANKAQASALKDALKAYKKLLAEQSVSGKQALGARQSALEAIQSGFAGALGETSRLGDAGEVSARDAAQEQFGQGTQMLIDRGMYNPEQAQYWRRGISSTLQRLLFENNARTAAARSGLLAQGGMAQAGAYGDIANQIGSNFGQRSGLYENMIGVGMSKQPYSADYSQSIGWLAAALSQMKFGGGGGAPSFFQGEAKSAYVPNQWQTLPFQLK